MAKDLKAFYVLITQNPDALAELNKKATKFEGDKEDEELVLEEIVIPYAKEHGYEFSIEDIRAFDGEGEISESELEAVSGGKTCICVLIGAVKGCGCFIVGGSSADRLGCVSAGVI